MEGCTRIRALGRGHRSPGPLVALSRRYLCQRANRTVSLAQTAGYACVVLGALGVSTTSLWGQFLLLKAQASQ